MFSVAIQSMHMREQIIIKIKIIKIGLRPEVTETRLNVNFLPVFFKTHAHIGEKECHRRLDFVVVFNIYAKIIFIYLFKVSF